MKKFIIVAAAMLMATNAFATDLIKKHSTLTNKALSTLSFLNYAPPPPVTSISVSGGVVSGADALNYNLDIEHYLYGSINGGFFIGGQVGRDETNGVSNNAEISAGTKFQIGNGVSIKGSAGLGQQWVPKDDFSYYVARLGIDSRLTENWTWNVAQYRYRNSFAEGHNYEQHRIGTGLSYNFTEQHSVFGSVYRDFNTQAGTEDNGVLFGYKFNF